MKFDDAMAQWLDDNAIDKAPTTAGWYRAMAKHLAPLGELDVTAVRAQDINPILRALSEAGKPATARGVQKTASGILTSQGVRLVGVRRPRTKKQTGRKGIWSGAQAGAFLAHTSGDRLAAAWALAVVGGMRRGELAGLRWSAVDLDAGVIYIRLQRTTLQNGDVHEDEPKGTSARTLPIGPALVAMLRERREAYDADARFLGKRFKGPQDGWVFGHKNGLPYYPAWFTSRWTRLCKDAEVPVIALHDGRHTSATVGADAGVGLKTMQARLGHSDPTILTRIYLHLVDDQARAAASVMERAMRLYRDAA